MENRSPLTTDSNLDELVKKLVERYQPVAIICFGSVHSTNVPSGPFQSGPASNHVDYFLLLVTPDTARLEHEVQGFVNNHYTAGSAIIVAHGEKSIQDALQKNNQFFKRVYRDGFFLYQAKGFKGLKDVALPVVNVDHIYWRIKLDYEFHQNLAEGFYEAIDRCLETDNWNGATFFMHQSVEQALLGLNELFLGYKADIHNLNRLIKLSKSYVQELAIHFPQNTAEERRLFDVLQSSFKNARYSGHDAGVNQDDVFKLFKVLDDFHMQVSKIGHTKLEGLKQELAELEGLPLVDQSVKSALINLHQDISLGQVEETVIAQQAPLVPKTKSRQDIVDFLIAVTNPALIYGYQHGHDNCTDSNTYLHITMVIPDGTHMPFKELEPMVTLAKLGDDKLTCSILLFSYLKKLITSGHIFYASTCIPANLIYDNQQHQLPLAGIEKMEKMLKVSKQQFTQGISRAASFLNMSRQAANGSTAAFMLHQAAELTYRTVILALFGQEVRSHSIGHLQKTVQICAPHLNECLPRAAENDKRLMTQLDEAYSTGRYRDNFKIPDEQFEILYMRITQLVRESKALLARLYPQEDAETTVSTNNSEPLTSLQ